MSKPRIIYQDWIVELGHDPAVSWQEAAAGDSNYNQRLIRAVNRSLACLTDEEAWFIRRFYFMGMGFREIGRITGREIYRLESIHNRALRKLRRSLRNLVGPDGRIKTTESELGCPVCLHEDRKDIDRLIEGKQPRETWRRILKILGDKYGLKIKAPQRLIGHWKYHMIGKEKQDGEN